MARTRPRAGEIYRSVAGDTFEILKVDGDHVQARRLATDERPRQFSVAHFTGPEPFFIKVERPCKSATASGESPPPTSPSSPTA
jgi:hypothetical protein